MTEATGTPRQSRMAIRVGFSRAGAVILLAAALAAAAWNWSALEASRTRIAAHAAVVTEAERLLSTLKDIETGQRGYLLVGNEDYLAPYNDAVAVLDARIAALRAAAAASGMNEADVRRLEEISHRKRAFAEQAVTARRVDGVAAANALVQEGEGRRIMDEARVRVEELQDEATARSERLTREDSRRYLLITVGSLGAAILAVAYFAALAIRRKRESDRNAALLEGVSANAPIGLGFLDGALRFRTMNKALARMAGTGRTGASVWDAFADLKNVLAPHVEAALRRGEAHADTQAETALADRPGEPRSLLVSTYPLHGRKRGAPVEGVGLVVVDATAVKTAERLLREREAEFRMLADNIPQLAWMTDATGAITWYNNRWYAFTGTTLEDMQGWGWQKVHHPDFVAEVTERFRQALAAGEPWEDTFPLRRHDGEYRWFLSRAVPILGDEGSVVRWFGTNTDVTAQREAEEALAQATRDAEEANRAKSQFLANMSHELRTPLSAVIGYSEMLQEEIEEIGETGLLADVGKIQSNARHLLGLINDVLDLSKIEAERMEVYAETFDAAEMVRDVAATVGALVAKKNNLLDIALGSEVGVMHTDQTKVRQCLINFLSNAAKFTENGRIVLDGRRVVRDGRDWLVFSVTDDGIGMTEEQLARLFQRFTQADASTTRRFGGSGLGLAISRAFARLLGGDVSVRSTYGAGTTFTLEMPAAYEAPGHEPTVERASDDGHRGCVLIVDDDPATRDLLARFLEKDGFCVETAADGESGLALVRKVRPRVVLLDVTMPRMDGWHVLRAIKADPGLHDTPVVMVSMLDAQTVAFSLGATDYLQKPVEWDRLKNIMEPYKDAAGGPILVVDDDPEARERLDAMLRREGWRVSLAQNGRVGLEAVAAERPALVLLDLMMPEMDGFEMLRALRARADWAGIPVVVLTAKDITAEDRRVLDGRADRVIRKGSLALRDLAGELRTILGETRARAAAP